MKKRNHGEVLGCAIMPLMVMGGVHLVTEKQCMALLRKWMRKQPAPLRCKRMFIVDRGDYWKWSAC